MSDPNVVPSQFDLEAYKIVQERKIDGIGPMQLKSEFVGKA